MTDATSGRRWPLVLAALLVALALGEAGARWRWAHPPIPPSDQAPAPRGMFVNDPITGYRLAAGFVDRPHGLSTNALGFRDKARVPGAGSVLRIVVTGDSFAAGVGVGDRQTLSRQLEQGLRRRGIAAEVWNLGVPHFGTAQAVDLLLAEWDRVQPDVVVHLLFTGNDAWDDLHGPSVHTVRDGWMTRRPWAPWPGERDRALRVDANRPLLAQGVVGDGLLWRFSSFYRLAAGGMHAARGASVPPWGMEPFDYEAFGGVAWLLLAPAPPPVRAGWAISEAAVGRLAERCGELGVPVVLVSAPMRAAVEGLAGVATGLNEDALDLRLPERRTEALAASAGVPLLPLLGGLQARAHEPVYYRDDSHWNAAGHRVAAIAIGEALAQRGWIPPVDGLREALEAGVPVGSAPATLREAWPR